MNSLSRIRSFFGFTQSQMADYCLVQQSVIAQHENGKRDLPSKAEEAVEEISKQLARFESPNLEELDSLFETSKAAELVFWRSHLEKVNKSIGVVREELNRLEESQKQMARVAAFTDLVAMSPENPFGSRGSWWAFQKEKQTEKQARVSNGVKQRLQLRLHLLQEEVKKSEEFLRFWESK